jgi:hypothetical protein
MKRVRRWLSQKSRSIGYPRCKQLPLAITMISGDSYLWNVFGISEVFLDIKGDSILFLKFQLFSSPQGLDIRNDELIDAYVM